MALQAEEVRQEEAKQQMGATEMKSVCVFDDVLQCYELAEELQYLVG